MINSVSSWLKHILELRKGLPLFRGLFHFVITIENPFRAFQALNKVSGIDAKLICFVIYLSIQIHVSSSSLLHIINWTLPAKYYIRNFDHSAIFLYSTMGHSAIWYFSLQYNCTCILLIMEICVMLFSVLFTTFFGVHKLKRDVRSFLYIATAIPMFPLIFLLFINKIYDVLAIILLNIYLAVVACITYSNRLPIIIPDVIEYHEVFHFLGYMAYKITCNINDKLFSLQLL